MGSFLVNDCQKRPSRSGKRNKTVNLGLCFIISVSIPNKRDWIWYTVLTFAIIPEVDLLRYPWIISHTLICDFITPFHAHDKHYTSVFAAQTAWNRRLLVHLSHEHSWKIRDVHGRAHWSNRTMREMYCAIRGSHHTIHKGLIRSREHRRKPSHEYLISSLL